MAAARRVILILPCCSISLALCSTPQLSTSNASVTEHAALRPQVTITLSPGLTWDSIGELGL